MLDRFPKQSGVLDRLGLQQLCFAVLLLLGLPTALPVGAAPLLLRLDAVRLQAGVSDELDRTMEDVIRRHADQWPAEGVVIEIPAGRWHLSRPLRFDAKRSGRNGAPLVLRGQADGSSVLSGAIPLKPLDALPDDLRRRLPADAARHVRAYTGADVQALLPTLRDRQGQGLDSKAIGGEPFFPGRSLTLARWPNGSFATSAAVIADKARFDTGATAQHWAAWRQAGNAWVHGYWGQDWADEWIAVRADADTPGVLVFQDGPPKYGLRTGARFRVYNVLEELDEPGEWHADAARGLILVWPPRDADAETLQMTRLESVVEARGASHLRFERLVIEGARGDAVVIGGGRDVVLSHCLVRHVGLRGVRLSGLAHQLLDSDVRDTGQGGAILWGGDRQALTPSSIVAAGNRFSNFNRWVRTYRPAVLVGGVGQEVRGNLVEGGPHTGLLFYGNDHLIEHNVFRSLATETGDVGAIYTGMDWTARGTVIRHNLLQDIRGPGQHGSRGVYLDDQTSGITVQGNVFVRVDQAVFLGGGRDNLVDGNLFVSSSPAIQLDDRGLTWQRALTTDRSSVLWQRFREVPVESRAYQRYPGLADLPLREPGRPSGNVARRNAVIDSTPFRFQGQAQKDLEVDRVFDATSFRLTPPPSFLAQDAPTGLVPADDSSAYREGFPRLPWNRMFCTFTRWQGKRPHEHPDPAAPHCQP